MPYVSVNLSKTVTPSQAKEIKSRIAEAIVLLPGKTEDVLMVQIDDGKTIFYQGAEMDNCAYVDARIYGTCALEHKQVFTKAMYMLFEEILGIHKSKMFLSILEYDTWGINGSLK